MDVFLDVRNPSSHFTTLHHFSLCFITSLLLLFDVFVIFFYFFFFLLLIFNFGTFCFISWIALFYVNFHHISSHLNMVHHSFALLRQLLSSFITFHQISLFITIPCLHNFSHHTSSSYLITLHHTMLFYIIWHLFLSQFTISIFLLLSSLFTTLHHLLTRRHASSHYSDYPHSSLFIPLHHTRHHTYTHTHTPSHPHSSPHTAILLHP